MAKTDDKPLPEYSLNGCYNVTRYTNVIPDFFSIGCW